MEEEEERNLERLEKKIQLDGAVSSRVSPIIRGYNRIIHDSKYINFKNSSTETILIIYKQNEIKDIIKKIKSGLEIKATGGGVSFEMIKDTLIDHNITELLLGNNMKKYIREDIDGDRIHMTAIFKKNNKFYSIFKNKMIRNGTYFEIEQEDIENAKKFYEIRS